ncbi:hypothetical protein SUGI_1203640 [Cryptomeria japonica]|nr:hypothetical protein SUGI_1203640 [Cryptomeria japonica]
MNKSRYKEIQANYEQKQNLPAYFKDLALCVDGLHIIYRKVRMDVSDIFTLHSMFWEGLVHIKGTGENEAKCKLHEKGGPFSAAEHTVETMVTSSSPGEGKAPVVMLIFPEGSWQNYFLVFLVKVWDAEGSQSRMVFSVI